MNRRYGRNCPLRHAKETEIRDGLAPHIVSNGVLARCPVLLVITTQNRAFRADHGNRNAVENVRPRHVNEALLRDGP